MEIRIISNLYNFNCDDLKVDGTASTIKVKDNFLISYDQSIKDGKFLDEDLRQAIGNIHMRALKEHTMFVAAFLEIPIDLPRTEIVNITDVLISSINGFVYNLWFIKDNCVKFSDIFILLLGVNKIQNGYIHNTNKETIVNASGKDELIAFSKEELEASIIITEKLTELLKKRDSDFGLRKEYQELENREFIQITTGIPHPDDYNDYNIIERALNFLRTARGISHLPHRLASYIPVFETLFGCGSSSEITYKISLRLAYYIGTDKDDKANIMELIKRVYNIRSRYFHGDVLDNKDRNIAEQRKISTEMDNLLRRAFVKIIMEDSAIFMGNSKSLENYFGGLILGA